MTDNEMAREILDSREMRWGSDGERVNLIVKALHSVRKEENRACAKIAEDFGKGFPIVNDIITDGEHIATAIRNRYKDEK